MVVFVKAVVGLPVGGGSHTALPVIQLHRDELAVNDLIGTAGAYCHAGITHIGVGGDGTGGVIGRVVDRLAGGDQILHPVPIHIAVGKTHAHQLAQLGSVEIQAVVSLKHPALGAPQHRGGAGLAVLDL